MQDAGKNDKHWTARWTLDRRLIMNMMLDAGRDAGRWNRRWTRTWKLNWTLERMQKIADQRWIERRTLPIMPPDARQNVERTTKRQTLERLDRRWHPMCSINVDLEGCTAVY